MKRNTFVKPWVLIIFINIIGYGLLSLSEKELNLDVLKIGTGVTLVLMFAYLIVNKMSSLSDNYIFLIVAMLFSVGEIMLCRLDIDFAQKQFMWLVISVVVFFVVYLFIDKLNIWIKLGYSYYILAIVLFVVTLVLGASRGGSKNWIIIGDYSFQPSEIIKLLTIFFLADRYTNPQRYRFKGLNEDIVSSLMIYALLGLLVLQREWGTAVLIFLIHVTLMYIYGTDFKIMLFNVLAAFAGGTLGVLFVSHIKVRISAWLDPWSQMTDRGYQITQSLFAITAGSFFGTGLGQGSPEYIPEVHSDFIFSAICEEFGVLGGVGVIFLYLLLVYRGTRISMQIENEFYRCVATGISIMMGFQTFIILGGVIKMIPLTGITMPFVSYGGSSLMTCFIAIAVLEACANKVVEKVAEADNEKE